MVVAGDFQPGTHAPDDGVTGVLEQSDACGVRDRDGDPQLMKVDDVGAISFGNRDGTGGMSPVTVGGRDEDSERAA